MFNFAALWVNIRRTKMVHPNLHMAWDCICWWNARERIPAHQKKNLNLVRINDVPTWLLFFWPFSQMSYILAKITIRHESPQSLNILKIRNKGKFLCFPFIQLVERNPPPTPSDQISPEESTGSRVLQPYTWVILGDHMLISIFTVLMNLKFMTCHSYTT